MKPTITVSIVRWNGHVSTTTLEGYLAESMADRAFADAKADPRTAFAIVTLSGGGFRHRYVAEPVK